MDISQRFERQHREIIELMEQIEGHLKPNALRIEAEDVRHLLLGLSGKLSVHLAMEDDALYPKLLTHPDQDVKNLTKSFKEEMGDLAESFKVYKQTWTKSQAIESNAQQFIDESKQVFMHLYKRISRENKELFPLVASK